MSPPASNADPMVPPGPAVRGLHGLTAVSTETGGSVAWSSGTLDLPLAAGTDPDSHPLWLVTDREAHRAVPSVPAPW